MEWVRSADVGRSLCCWPPVRTFRWPLTAHDLSPTGTLRRHYQSREVAGFTESARPICPQHLRPRLGVGVLPSRIPALDEATDENREPLDLGLERCECLAIGTVADHGPHGVHRTPPVERSPAPGAFISSRGVNCYLLQPLIQPGWTLEDFRGQ